MKTARRIARIKPLFTHQEKGFKGFWAIEESVDPGYHYPQKKLNYLTLELTLAGAAVTRCGRDAVELQPNSLIVMPSNIRFETKVDAIHGWKLQYLMISGHWARRIEQDIFNNQRKLFHFSHTPAPLRDSLQQAISLALNQPPHWRWAFMQQFCQTISLLQQLPSPNDSSHDITTSVRQLVHQSPQRAWTVSELASAMGVSPSSLWHRFKAITGQTPAAFVRHERMLIAHRLLEQGMKVTRVAEYLGCSSPYSFSRSFKAETGRPPSLIKATGHPK